MRFRFRNRQRRQERQKEALVRQEERAKRTNQQQLELIATRRGSSAKESARLLTVV